MLDYAAARLSNVDDLLFFTRGTARLEICTYVIPLRNAKLKLIHVLQDVSSRVNSVCAILIILVIIADTLFFLHLRP